jgi:precorrin-6B C5,15-methyltransferase / cobalt-precorrin-6B C5,C15-methyltransferase
VEPAWQGHCVTIVGIGADGWPGLAEQARGEVTAAEVVLGGERQLGMLPDTPGQERVPWPSPLLPALERLLERHRDRRVCVLASGDPMHFGIGSTLARMLGPGRLRVYPHPSSLTLACARLGWALQEVEVLSAVGRPLAALQRHLQPGNRILVLAEDAHTPVAVAGLLRESGYGPSAMTLLEDLGGPEERVLSAAASRWAHPPGSALNIVAVECAAEPGALVLPLVPGLAESVFDHDGQITKREVRAVTLARLAPTPGALLWDVGAGSGSVAVEWMRAHSRCRAVAVESRADRAERITRNAERLGVPGLRTVVGRAPEALAGLERPDAAADEHGVGDSAVLEACWQALPPGGRLVANAVTLDAEAHLAQWHHEHGGDLTRLEVSRAAPLGGHQAWRPARPITQWTGTK